MIVLKRRREVLELCGGGRHRRATDTRCDPRQRAAAQERPASRGDDQRSESRCAPMPSSAATPAPRHHRGGEKLIDILRALPPTGGDGGGGAEQAHVVGRRAASRCRRCPPTTLLVNVSVCDFGVAFGGAPEDTAPASSTSALRDGGARLRYYRTASSHRRRQGADAGGHDAIGWRGARARSNPRCRTSRGHPVRANVLELQRLLKDDETPSICARRQPGALHFSGIGVRHQARRRQFHDYNRVIRKPKNAMTLGARRCWPACTRRHLTSEKFRGAPNVEPGCAYRIEQCRAEERRRLRRLHGARSRSASTSLPHRLLANMGRRWSA